MDGASARDAVPRPAEPETLELSIVVPTRNEEPNVGPLLERLGACFKEGSAEVIVVDDSDDDTPRVVEELKSVSALPVRLVHRLAGERTAGLSGAVVAGIGQARGSWVLVMDADLQHPPEVAAVLARTAAQHDADIVIGTRYAGKGSNSGLDGALRAAVSRGVTRFVKALFPRRLARVSDPLSGLFVFRRAAVPLERLRPTGFKILLEILVRAPLAKVAEVSYDFAPRQAGSSKASLGEGGAFLRHLARLRTSRLADQLGEGDAAKGKRASQPLRLLAFGLVGLSGLAVNTAALWLFYQRLGVNHLLGAGLATEISTAWNFLLVDLLVYRRNAHGTRGRRAAGFFAMNNLLLVARLPLLQLLVVLGMGVLAANVVSLVVLFLVRFLVSDRAIFTGGAEKARDPVKVLVDLTALSQAAYSSASPILPNPAPSAAPGLSAGKRSRYLPYRYDIDGVATLGSQVLLPELEFFRAQWVDEAELDLELRVGDVGSRLPRLRPALTQCSAPAAIRYEEHLGRLGANFRVELGEPISVEVAPLLAHSSHVVYTNIIEPILRFLIASRGRMLLHSACIELDGVGVMLSARTDTGKTGTVLRLLREHGGRFLSDDMTIIDPQGQAACFPKPLTISAHTLRAVRAEDLTPSEWRRLQLQGRLHSKGGRSVGMTLSRLNLPIMGMNAITQMLVPPPKYFADRLVGCQLASSTVVRDLFVIERGEPGLLELESAVASQLLIENTEDAYGFPPFQHLAPALSIAGQSSRELRQVEAEVLRGFLQNVRVRVLSSDNFGWADEIPRLVGEGAARAVSSEAAGTGVQARQLGWPRWEPELLYRQAG